LNAIPTKFLNTGIHAFSFVVRNRDIMKEKLGDPKGIITRGENIITFKKIFLKETFFSSKRWWGIQLRLFKLYINIVKDVVPPVLEEM